MEQGLAAETEDNELMVAAVIMSNLHARGPLNTEMQQPASPSRVDLVMVIKHMHTSRLNSTSHDKSVERIAHQ